MMVFQMQPPEKFDAAAEVEGGNRQEIKNREVAVLKGDRARLQKEQL